MNCQSSKVILKKLQRINNLNKYLKLIILDICNGSKHIRPVYKIPDKLTVIDCYDELIKVLFKLNINFVVSNDAPRNGRIGILITIKTYIKNGNNTTNAPKIKRGT